MRRQWNGEMPSLAKRGSVSWRTPSSSPAEQEGVDEDLADGFNLTGRHSRQEEQDGPELGPRRKERHSLSLCLPQPHSAHS